MLAEPSSALLLVAQIGNACPVTPLHRLHRLPAGSIDVLQGYIPCSIPFVVSSIDIVAGNTVGAATLVSVSSFASPGGVPVVFASAPASPVVSSSSGSSAPRVSIPHPSRITPLVYSHWLTELQGFSDPAVVATVLAGIREGFCLGFKGNSCKSTPANMGPTLENPLMVDQYLLTECSLGCVAGPFVSLPFPNLHVSWFGAI